MASSYTKSLKIFLLMHPPILVFICCLVVFGLSVITLAILVGKKELPNPDVEVDWNTFLSNLARWEVCKQRISKVDAIVNKFTASDTAGTNSESVMVQMMMSWKPMDHGSRDVTFVSGSVHGSPGKERELLHVLMHTAHSPLYNGTCSTDWCTVTMPACLTFMGSLNMLPNTRKPQSCSDNFDFSTDEAVFYKASTSSFPCSDNDLLQTTYVPNPDLTVMLTYRERSIVNVHLMHTGYFILLVALTLFCSILLRDHFISSSRSEDKYLAEEVPLGSIHHGI